VGHRSPVTGHRAGYVQFGGVAIAYPVLETLNLRSQLLPWFFDASDQAIGAIAVWGRFHCWFEPPWHSH
jgi:hypothetical protein